MGAVAVLIEITPTGFDKNCQITDKMLEGTPQPAAAGNGGQGVVKKINLRLDSDISAKMYWSHHGTESNDIVCRLACVSLHHLVSRNPCIRVP